MTTLEQIQNTEYVILKTVDLMALLADLNANNKKNARKKWITINEAIKQFGVTRYWLTKSENEPYSKLRVNVGSGKTSTKKYHVESIEEELERQAV